MVTIQDGLKYSSCPATSGCLVVSFEGPGPGELTIEKILHTGDTDSLNVCGD